MKSLFISLFLIAATPVLATANYSINPNWEKTAIGEEIAFDGIYSTYKGKLAYSNGAMEDIAITFQYYQIDNVEKIKMNILRSTNRESLFSFIFDPLSPIFNFRNLKPYSANKDFENYSYDINFSLLEEGRYIEGALSLFDSNGLIDDIFIEGEFVNFSFGCGSYGYDPYCYNPYGNTPYYGYSYGNMPFVTIDQTPLEIIDELLQYFWS